MDYRRQRISISAEVKHEKEVKEGERLLRSERSYGMTSPQFHLADEVDQSKVQAKYNNGILELTLPKSQAQCARKSPFHNLTACTGRCIALVSAVNAMQGGMGIISLTYGSS